jgi:cyclopropane-fatty-acyl-phospholipid synthase
MSLQASDNRPLFAGSPFSKEAPRHRCDPGSVFLRLIASRLGCGTLHIESPSGGCLTVDATLPGPAAHIALHRWRPLRRMLFSGDLGFAESYIDGDWSSRDLVRLMELAARNIDLLDPTIRPGWPSWLLNRLRHRGRSNTLSGSRRNIVEHYDLGNDFYSHWLDAGMSYSSALYSFENETLEQAQAAKQRRIVDLLDLAGGERVLEVGCGWGGMAEVLARAGSGPVTAITLSPSQLAHAERRLEAAGVKGNVDVRLSDYRHVEGRFDRIVSVEMLEAVGADNWPRYFEMLRDRLVPGGVAVVQVITIADRRYEAYRRTVDFIQRHIFPGGMLPSPSIMRDQIARAGLNLTSCFEFGDSYARTLAEWNRRFQEAWPALAALGFSERFKRKWEYYLAYCEAGFRSGLIDVGLYRIARA